MSKWREQYKVHPAADVFPMMSDEELAELGEDIKANGQTIPVLLWTDDKETILIDGRNRLEAMERVGIKDRALVETFHCKDPVTHIITLNIRRRHLTKQQQADLIVAAIKAGDKLDQVEPVSEKTGFEIDNKKLAALSDGNFASKGGRGKRSGLKSKATVAAGKDHGISEATVKRAIAKAEGRAPKQWKLSPTWDAKLELDAARGRYLARCTDPRVDLDAEQKRIFDAFREIAGNRLAQKPADGGNGDGRDDCVSENCGAGQ